MSDLQEYVVALKSKEDLDSFYDDIETPGGSLYIPNRAVSVADRRSMSRNTHYYLSADEAELIKKDPRVLTVGLTPRDLGIQVKPAFTQTSDDWNKSSINNSTDKNWGLLRCYEGAQRANWGINGTAAVSGTVQVNAEGRNVDVVIVDGMVNPDHPEFAVNADGTGGSRVVQYNWFQHNAEVWPGNPSNTYVYTPYAGGGDLEADNNHGAHVAGTACGNTQGWARKSNIYNINPYGTDPNGLDTLRLFDYIRAFHNSKPINPATGRRNPTICNNSWGFFYSPAISTITNLIYRGNAIAGPFTPALLKSYGVWVDSFDRAILGARYYPLEVDILDAIEDGIIMVGAAGNNYTKIVPYTDIDYDNYFVAGSYSYWYHEGGSPSSASTPDGIPTTICVGAIGVATTDAKADYSNCGPRTEIYAPGTNIISSFNSTASYGGTADPRNSAYKIGKISGSSMASPQITGVLACALESYPQLTHAQSRSYLTKISRTDQITDTAGGYTDYTALQGSPNRYLRYYEERPNQGSIFPKQNYFVRPATGAVYPRTKIRR
jgi:hypothetical protein